MPKVSSFFSKSDITKTKFFLAIAVASNAGVIFLLPIIGNLEKVGQYAVFISSSTILSTVSLLGAPTTIIRDLSGVVIDRNTIKSTLIRTLKNFATTIVIIYLIFQCINIYGQYSISLNLILLGAVGHALFLVASSLTRSIGWLNQYRILQAMTPFLVLLSGTLYYVLVEQIRYEYFWIILNCSIPLLLICMILWKMPNEFVSLYGNSNRNKESISVLANDIVLVSTAHSIAPLVSLFSGMETAGLFAVIQRCMRLITIQQASLAAIAAPRLRELIQQDRLELMCQELRTALKHNVIECGFSFLIALPFILAYFYSVFPEQFFFASLMFSIVSVAQIFALASGPINQILILGKSPISGFYHSLIFMCSVLLGLLIFSNFVEQAGPFLAYSLSIILANIVGYMIWIRKLKIRFPLWVVSI